MKPVAVGPDESGKFEPLQAPSDRVTCQRTEQTLPPLGRRPLAYAVYPSGALQVVILIALSVLHDLWQDPGARFPLIWQQAF